MSSKRKDEKYIYNEDNQPNKGANLLTFLRYRWLMVLLLFVALFSIILIVLRFITPLAQWKPTEFFAIFTLSLAVIAVLERSYNSFSQRQYRIIAKLSISMQREKHIKITATVQNAGTVRIEPDNISVFLDSGVFNPESKRYDFPFLLKHEKKGEKQKYDCVLSEYCQTGKEFYPKDIVDNNPANGLYKSCFRMCYKLSHLSAESILYIGSGETFSEDIVIKLDEPGVYRAILIVTAKDKACDCMCTSQQFVVNEVGGGS